MNISELTREVAELRKTDRFHEQHEMFLARALTAPEGPIERAKAQLGRGADVMSKPFMALYAQMELTSGEAKKVLAFLGAISGMPPTVQA